MNMMILDPFALKVSKKGNYYYCGDNNPQYWYTENITCYCYTTFYNSFLLQLNLTAI